MYSLVRKKVPISLIPGTLPDFTSQPWSCEIKSGSGLGTRLDLNSTIKGSI